MESCSCPSRRGKRAPTEFLLPFYTHKPLKVVVYWGEGVEAASLHVGSQKAHSGKAGNDAETYPTQGRKGAQRLSWGKEREASRNLPPVCPFQSGKSLPTGVFYYHLTTVGFVEPVFMGFLRSKT